MSCCHPMKAFWTGCYTETGALDLVIMPSTSGNYLHPKVAEKRGHHVSIFAPMVKMNGEAYLSDPLAIPCGSCVGCRMDRAREWKVRCCHEKELYPDDHVHFVTLTYDDAHLPINENGEPYINRRDFQLFMKRLRFKNNQEYRYFGCMEYGEHGHRPHAHAILFGALPLVPVDYKKSTSPWLDDAWTDFSGDRKPRGSVIVEPCNENTIAYVAGYVEKKQCDPMFYQYPVKPFLMMSTKPSIGSHHIRSLDGDRHVYGNFGNTHYAKVPRAYLKKCKDAPWYEKFKDDSKLIARSCLESNIGVCKTVDEEIIGFIYEDAFLHQLENLRSATL